MDMRGRIGGKCTSGLSGINGTIAHQRQTGEVRNNSYLEINKRKRIWTCKFASAAFPEMWFQFKWDSIAKKIVEQVDEDIMKVLYEDEWDPNNWDHMDGYYIIRGSLRFDEPSQLRLRFLDEDTLRIDCKNCPETWLEFSVPK